MALEKQQLNIPFSQGVDTKTDPKQLQIGKLVELENGTLQKTGAITKRAGGSLLPSSNSIGVGNFVAGYNDELVTGSDTEVFSYNQAGGAQVLKGYKMAASLQTYPVARNSYEQKDPCVAINSNGYECHAYIDSSLGAVWTLFDTNTKQAVYAPQVASATGTSILCVALGNTFVIVFQAGTSLQYRVITGANATPTASGTIATVTGQGFDLITDGTNVFVAHPTASGYQVREFNADLSSLLFTYSDTVSQVETVSISFFLSQVWVGFKRATGAAGYIVLNSDLGVVAGPYTIVTDVDIKFVHLVRNANTSTIYAYITHKNATNAQNSYIERCTITSGGTIGTIGLVCRSVEAYSKPVYSTEVQSILLAVSHESTLQATYWVMNEGNRTFAKVSPSTGGGHRSFSVAASLVFNPSNARELFFDYEIKDFLSSVNGDVFTQTGANSAKITLETPVITAVGGANLHMTGAQNHIYDGKSVVEEGFDLYPEGLTSVVDGVGGNLAQGSYQYAATYEWTDNQGQVHKSAPSQALTVSTVPVTVYDINASVNTTGGFNVTTANDALRFSAGYKVVGANLSAGSFIKGFDASSGRAAWQYEQTRRTRTDPVASGVITSNYNLTPQAYYPAFVNTAGTRKFFVFDQITRHFVVQSFTTNTITFKFVHDLRLGFRVTWRGSNGVITAINGNTVTVSTSAGNVNLESGDIVEVLGQDTGLNWTNGSTTISWANAWNNNNIFVGSVIFPETFATDFAGSGFIVVSKGAFPNFVIDRAPSATRTNIAAQIPAQLPPPRVGQTLIINDRGVTTATITAVEQRTTSPINKTEVTINQTFTSSGDLDVLSENCMSASVVVPTLRVTEKKSANGDCQIVLWRTTVNGTQFYRASSLTAPTFNSTTTDSVTFFDPITDGNLIGNEVLYTSGGVVENISPPAFSTVIPYKTRLLGLSSEDGSVWFSKEILPTAPVEWSDLFTIRAPEQGGKITALGQMDDKAILFKEGSMFLLAGDGPTATGVNNDFIVPQFITADAGCTEVKSVVTMPQGLMFKSNKGFYLLDRSLNSRYIGDRVEGYNALTVNLSKLIESLNQVRFALSDGNVIVYDYYSDNWYTYTGMEAKDATEFQGQYTYVKANGLVIKENPAVFTDNGTGVNLKVKTGWISFAGVQGFQRIYKAIILGDYKSAHSLTVTINQDFATTSPQTVSIVQNTSVTPVQYRVFTSVQKSESMQMTIQETGATGEGLVLSGIAFEFGIKKGLNKMPASKSYG